MGRSVLCVDSDRNLCQVMAKALEAEGYAVATQYDGERALAQIAQDPPDLVLLELFLPGRDGFSVLEAVRKLPEPAGLVPVVLLSGCSATPEYRRRAQLLDALTLLTKPVPLDRLKQVVADQLGPVRPRSGKSRKRAKATGELSGRLERFSLAALLHHLHGLRASGVLHLQAGRKRKWVQLREGYPTAVRSNLVNECLGNFLASSGRISEEAMKESLRRLEPGRLQGEILVAMAVLSEEDVSQALREQAEAKIFEIFAWPRGVFRFEFGGMLEKASGLARRSPANWILEGVRTRMPLERIDGWIKAKHGLRLSRGRAPFYRFQEVDLDPEERRFVETLDGSRYLAGFRKAEESLRRTLYALVCTGLVELGRSGSAEPPPVAPAPRRARATPSPEAEARRVELATLAERIEGQDDHYAVLGLANTASENDVRGAYEQLAELAHPDRVSTSSESVRELAARVFRRVEQAYETLLEPRRRQQYLLDRKRVHREAEARAEGLRAVEAERHFQDGEAALRQRAYELALRCFGKSLELYPEEGEYHAYYGWALHLCHPDDATMVEEAIEHVRRGIKLASDREKPYLLMGRLCKAIGRVGAAERMFTRAVQIQPDCVEALRELRLINMRRQKQKGFIGRLLRR